MSANEVSFPPEDAVSCLRFSPESVPKTFLVATSWANDARLWEIQNDGTTIPIARQTHNEAILSCAWSTDGTKVFTASCDNTAKMWDLQSNQQVQIAQHDKPIKTIHYIQYANYTCVMTGSWDQTLKFWDLRSKTPLKTFNLPDKCYCADVDGPIAVVSGANRYIKLYHLDGLREVSKIFENNFKFQHSCLRIFQDAMTKQPTGFALGSIEGRVAIHYLEDDKERSSKFEFKCHRSKQTTQHQPQDIYAVNDMAFHPKYMTLATVGSDGNFHFWDIGSRLLIKSTFSINRNIPITSCTIDARGKIFAYAYGYDWHKGHEFNNPEIKSSIHFLGLSDDLKPTQGRTDIKFMGGTRYYKI